MAPIKRARSLREAATARVLRFGVKRARRQRHIARKAEKKWRKLQAGAVFHYRPPPKRAERRADDVFRSAVRTRAEIEHDMISDAENRFLGAKNAAKRVPKRYIKLARKIAGKRRNA